MAGEDEFSKRDAMGLDKSPQHKTEAECRAFYMKMIGTLAFVVAPVLAFIVYFGVQPNAISLRTAMSDSDRDTASSSFCSWTGRKD